MRRLPSCATLIAALWLSACVTGPEHYRPAGFNSSSEASSYAAEYLYFAKKLTTKEWENFYARFPEYWKDLQTAKMIGATMEYHPMYTAYSFRWNMLRRKAAWAPETVARLDRAEVATGDDVFQISYAIGAPARLIWDNDCEVLIYASGQALLMEQGVLQRVAPCPGCAEVRNATFNGVGYTDAMVLEQLGLKRPRY